MSGANIYRFDTTDPNNIYLGEASPKVTTSQAFWRIQRVSIAGTLIDIKYADGSSDFIKVWDNRAGYTYL